MQESGENYLESILILKNKNGFVRSIDIANWLNYSKPSVSRAVGILKQDGYITVDPGGEIHLTEKGREKAEEIYERHNLIAQYLILTLGVDQDVASADACRIEHILSDEVFQKIKKYVLAGNGGK